MEKTVQKSEDRRVKRTKKALRECLFRLLEEKTADEITVKELTDAADINRSTFYFYYKDINDMIVQIQNGIYDVFEQEVLLKEAYFETEEDFVSYLVRFFRFCRENEKICRLLISNDPNNHLSNRVKDAVMEHVPDSAKVFAENDPRKYLTNFAVAAFRQTILDWMYDGMKADPDEMAWFMTKCYFSGGRKVLLTAEAERKDNNV